MKGGVQPKNTRVSILYGDHTINYMLLVNFTRRARWTRLAVNGAGDGVSGEPAATSSSRRPKELAAADAASEARRRDVAVGTGDSTVFARERALPLPPGRGVGRSLPASEGSGFAFAGFLGGEGSSPASSPAALFGMPRLTASVN